MSEELRMTGPGAASVTGNTALRARRYQLILVDPKITERQFVQLFTTFTLYSCTLTFTL